MGPKTWTKMCPCPKPGCKGECPAWKIGLELDLGRAIPSCKECDTKYKAKDCDRILARQHQRYIQAKAKYHKDKEQAKAATQPDRTKQLEKKVEDLTKQLAQATANGTAGAGLHPATAAPDADDGQAIGDLVAKADRYTRQAETEESEQVKKALLGEAAELRKQA